MERFVLPFHRGISVKSIFTFVLVVLVTALLWVVLGGQTAHAADANWSGEAIVYDGHGYSKPAEFKDTSNTIPAGATVYQTPVQTIDGSTDKKVFVLYFTSGVDPPTATSAKFVEFTYNKDKTVSNPKNTKDVTLILKGKEEVLSSCAIEGIGWIICPVSVFIAQGMDKLFDDVLAPLIEVQPSVLGDPNNSMYVAWNVMRSIANIAFVIVFLIIIYSQLTNFGVSNYGLKKLVPRLIIAAVLVNLSFIVAAAAIDLSNIFGHSIQSIFNTIRDDLFHLTNDDVSGANASPWTSVTAAILAGGGLVGGVYYLASSGAWLLIPLLLGLISVLILVVVVLAARQAIIVILVIIAPLAFVANLLPNTEKWFDKWKDIFFTMLVFFPAFSLVYGGSQLAGQIIIQNAGDSIVMLLFGLAVQIAPLVITPLILKFSGGLLGRIAQITNNPSKGLLDRNKNWANNRAAYTKNRNLAGEGRKFNPTTWGAGMVRGMNGRKKNLENWTKAYGEAGENRYHDRSKKYAKINTYNAGVGLDKDRIHNHHEEHNEKLKTTPGSSLYDRTINTEASKDSLNAAQNRTAEHLNRRRVVSGNPLNTAYDKLEASKSSLETSENDKNVYLNRQRMMAGSVLNATVAPLESSKLRVESTQNQYGTMVENMKLDPKSTMYQIAQGAQSSKEHLEAAQSQVQALFDSQRTKAGTGLNISALELDASKSVAQGSKAAFEGYITNQRVDNVDLRLPTIIAEQNKQAQQTAEARLATMVEGYKTGKIDPTTLSAQETIIMNDMKAESIKLSAQKQATLANQYEVQRNIAEVMTGNGTLTDQMLDIAQGVGGDTARFRAQAQAVKAAKSLDSDALTANVALLKNEAERAGTNIKRYSNGLLDAVLNGLPMYENQYITPEMTKAAMQAQAEEKNIPLFEKMKGSTNFDQAMINEIVGLNNAGFKAAGAFGLQDDPTLNIDNFDSKEEYEHALSVQRISNLANTNASGLSGLKFGWVANSLAKPSELKKNINAVLFEVQKGKNPGATEEEQAAGSAAEASLHAAYRTVRGALMNDDILDTIRDREPFIRTIEAELARIHGQKPVENSPVELTVDAADYANMDLPEESKVDPNILNSVDDDDDNLNQPNA